MLSVNSRHLRGRHCVEKFHRQILLPDKVPRIGDGHGSDFSHTVEFRRKVRIDAGPVGRHIEPGVPGYYLVAQGRVETDRNGDGRVDTWEYYEGGKLDRIGTDNDGDGIVDKWERLRTDETRAPTTVPATPDGDTLERH